MHCNIQSITEYAVAPRVGAWIETFRLISRKGTEESHPEWVRGLKHLADIKLPEHHGVAPRVGAWIETDNL